MVKKRSTPPLKNGPKGLKNITNHINKINLSPLEITFTRLKLTEQLELVDALNAIRRAINHGWLMEAEVLCRFILSNRPEQPDAWALRGETALADNDPASARVFFHEALKSLDALPSVQDLRRQRYVYWQAIAECNTLLNRHELAADASIQSAKFNLNATVSANTEDVGILLNKAYKAVMQNLLDEAEPLLNSILQVAPSNAYAWQGMAVMEHKRGNHEAAISAIDKAIELNPNESSFWNNRGVVLKPLGAPKTNERIRAYKRATEINPDFKEAYSNLADALTSARSYEEAGIALEAAFAIDSNYVGAHINAVNLLKSQGKKKEALSKIEIILEKTRHPEALNLKGALLLEMGNAHLAIDVLEESRQIDSRNASVLNNLGNAYLATGRSSKAIEAYRSAVILSPGMAEAQANLALALLTQIQHGAPRGEYLALAKDHLAKAQMLDSDMPQLFVAEGVLKLQHENDREGARVAYEKALDLQPESVQALMGLSGIAADMGDREQARQLQQRAADFAPDDTEVMTNYIFALNYDPESTLLEIFNAAKSYGHHIEEKSGEAYSHWSNSRDSKKCLKVGFVSGDFRKHPITYFTTGLFEHLPRNEIEVFAYHNHVSHDEMTSKIKGLVDHWRVIADQDSKSVCELIRTDGIDVLIDLSGHTGYHRLDVFAKKPAPVSASWLGFVSTTGVRNIDYFIATECLIAHEEAKYYTEEIAYLPKDTSWASFNICAEVMSSELPPCIKNDYITFGSFNNLIKVNENVLNSWAKILLAVPNSKLFLNYKQLLDNHVRIKTIKDFKRLGIDESRLRLECTSPRSNTLNAYSEIDIALDPFPYGGGTTTCEALYMGVPVITLKGDRFSGRLTQDYLKHFFWSAIVTGNTQDEYVEKAVELAKNKDFLMLMRKQQRDVFESSISNHQSFAKEFSKLMRSLFYKKYGE